MNYDFNTSEEDIKSLSNKLFVLLVTDTKELICTYNIDVINYNVDHIIPHTIMTHRKRETNTLYTVSALNILISSLNNGYYTTNYRLDWSNYKNMLLITRDNKLCMRYTKIFDVIHLNNK